MATRIVGRSEQFPSEHSKVQNSLITDRRNKVPRLSGTILCYSAGITHHGLRSRAYDHGYALASILEECDCLAKVILRQHKGYLRRKIDAEFPSTWI